jgi:hypothetical protein
MSPCIIVALPEAVVRVILVDIRHVVRLDSAVCAKEIRVPYLATAYAPSARYSFDDNTNCGHGCPGVCREAYSWTEFHFGMGI